MTGRPPATAGGSALDSRGMNNREEDGLRVVRGGTFVAVRECVIGSKWSELFEEGSYRAQNYVNF
jgi:hypothetical protein